LGECHEEGCDGNIRMNWDYYGGKGWMAMRPYNGMSMST